LGFGVGNRLKRGSSKLGQMGEDCLEDRIVRSPTGSETDYSDSFRPDFECKLSAERLNGRSSHCEASHVGSG